MMGKNNEQNRGWISRVTFGLYMVIVILITNSSASIASAYFTHDYKWNIDPVIYHNDSGYSEVGAAASSWDVNNAPQYSSGSYEDCDVLITKEAVDEDWDGLTSTYASGGTILQSDFCLNSNFCDSYSSYARRSVICHEIGHTLGMRDNYLIENYYAVMNPYTYGGGGYSRYGHYGIFSPQTDDDNGIAYLYG
jgi:hypothetical protein